MGVGGEGQSREAKVHLCHLFKTKILDRSSPAFNLLQTKKTSCSSHWIPCGTKFLRVLIFIFPAIHKNKKVCPISRTWTLLQWSVVCKNKVLIGVSLYVFGNRGWGYYLRFVFYCNGSIILQVFLAKREGLFNLSHFLGDISRFRVVFTAKY